MSKPDAMQFIYVTRMNPHARGVVGATVLWEGAAIDDMPQQYRAIHDVLYAALIEMPAPDAYRNTIIKEYRAAIPGFGQLRIAHRTLNRYTKEEYEERIITLTLPEKAP